MKTHRVLAAILLSACAVRADVVTDWNETALQAIRTDKTSPPKASRALALLHTAIYDAINGITQTHERYMVPGKPAGVASPEAAASAAGHLVLVRLFPAQQTAIDTAHNKALAAIPNSPEKNTGIHWGEWAANIILVARSTDGGEETVTHLAKDAPGEWQPTPPASAPALLPQWARLACFAMTSGSQFRPPRMPALTSAVYAVDFNLTKQLGAKSSTARTAEQTAIAQFWADGAGTVTPPGHWNVIARDLSAQRKLTLPENARLFAMLNIALADAAILCWDCKFDCNFWRPITAIQNADSDKNPATEKDAAWMPLLDTPPFPEYTSGHSTFSGAAATVLAAFFGSDEIAFSTTSDAMQGFSRSFHSFSEAAAEAGISRIFGGIHFMSANQQGLASGARLGTYVAENFLKEKRNVSMARPAPAQATVEAQRPIEPSVVAAAAPVAVTTRPPAPAPSPVPAATPAPSVKPSAPTDPALPPFPAAIPVAELDRVPYRETPRSGGLQPPSQ